VIPLVLLGAWGRMGRAVEAAAEGAHDLRVVARVGEAGRIEIAEDETARHPAGYAQPGEPGSARPAPPGEGPLGSVLLRGDIVIDFSSPGGLAEAARACAFRGAALVTGTTGLSPQEERLLEEAAARVPVLRAANFSLGLLALRRALGEVLEKLPTSWDIEIIERHHRRKVDSPSGTALVLAQEAAARRGLDSGALRHGRSGRVGPRPEGEIGIHAVRGGTWVGDHAVLLAGDGESLELRHVVEDRAAFAHGALAAARFVAQAAPGRYALEDVLSARGRTG
jgi:4-hydroxy-tetrahydrodipicolinate reductase